METQLETGCYVDGIHGIYVYRRVTDLAAEFGYKGTLLTDDDCMDATEDSDLLEVVDEAIDWLNTNVTVEGYSFGFYDGDFMYWSDADWQEAYGI